MTLDSSGNVGIGIDSPAVPLHISSNNGALARFANNSATDTTSYITVINANDTSNGTVVAHISDGTSYIGNQQNNALRLVTNDTERMRIDSSGNVGIGTDSPSNKFVVAEGTNQHGIEFAPGTLSYIQAYDRATSDYGNLKIDAEYIAFGTNNGSERMRIDSSGKVGIWSYNSICIFNCIRLRRKPICRFIY